MVTYEDVEHFYHVTKKYIDREWQTRFYNTHPVAEIDELNNLITGSNGFFEYCIKEDLDLDFLRDVTWTDQNSRELRSLIIAFMKKPPIKEEIIVKAEITKKGKPFAEITRKLEIRRKGKREIKAIEFAKEMNLQVNWKSESERKFKKKSNRYSKKETLFLTNRIGKNKKPKQIYSEFLKFGIRNKLPFRTRSAIKDKFYKLKKQKS